MEDDFKFSKWKTTLIFWQMEDDLNILKMEDDFNILVNGRRPQYAVILKATSMFLAHQK